LNITSILSYPLTITTYILQAILRYRRIKGINIINTRICQLLLVIIQWSIDLAFDLLILLTDHLNKLRSDSSLIFHVRTSTSAATVISQRQINYDLTMVRCMLLLISLLIVCGLPFSIFLVIAWINSSRLAFYHLHVAFITMNASLRSLLLIHPICGKVYSTPSVKYVHSLETVRS